MKKFYLTINIIVFFIFIVSVSIIVIDPYFHYHKPLKNIHYNMNNKLQRYINDGIIRNFEYDAIITGTSMTENFKSTQFDKIFKSNSIKIPFSGATYKEINDNLERALDRKNHIRYVFRGLDYGGINLDYEKMAYNTYPTYLYDNNIFNDYKYFLSKDAFLQSIMNVFSLDKEKNINFDLYSSWRNVESGKKKILKNSKRLKKNNEEKNIKRVNREKIIKNIENNVTNLPKKYPETKFIYFITPYSIIYWDKLNEEKEIEMQIKIEEILIESLLDIPNIELYSFFNNYDLICNLENYIDSGHYIGKVNDQILEWISKKEYKITKENYKKYLEKNLKFYKSYNYDNIYR